MADQLLLDEIAVHGHDNQIQLEPDGNIGVIESKGMCSYVTFFRPIDLIIGVRQLVYTLLAFTMVSLGLHLATIYPGPITWPSIC
jgi:hypothetical protein